MSAADHAVARASLLWAHNRQRRAYDTLQASDAGADHERARLAYCAACEVVERALDALLAAGHCSGCSGYHPGEVCPNRPDDSDPRMADLSDDSPQNEGEV